MFKNLKITFKMRSELILHRFTTIDSILLAQHYALERESGAQEKGVFIETEDDLENISKWLEVKNGVLSGSIWYVGESSDLFLWNAPVRKSTDQFSIYEYTGKAVTSQSKPSPQGGEFKRFDLAFETMRLDEIYFYIRGDEAYIKKLASRVKSIGKKASVGFGWVDSFTVDIISKDKSFMLDDYTPSKPLPLNSFSVDSKKIAFHRALPPYSSKKNKVVCYMPTTSLIERSDESRKNTAFTTYIPEHYISNTSFLRKHFESGRVAIPEKKGKYEVFDNASSSDGLFASIKVEGDCACCGAVASRGVKGNIKALFSANFNDFPYLSSSDVVCEDCFWSTTAVAEKKIGFTYATTDSLTYIKGGNMQVFSENKKENTKLQSQYRKEFIEGFEQLKAPFSLNLKTTTNTQHVAMRGEVSLSSAYISVNYGDSGVEFVDVELMSEALTEMKRLIVETKGEKKGAKGLSKAHFLNLENYKGNPNIPAEANTIENRKLLSDYHKKYNSSIRKVLNMVVL